MNDCEYCKSFSNDIINVPFECYGQTLFTANLCPSCIAKVKEFFKKPKEELEKIFETVPRNN